MAYSTELQLRNNVSILEPVDVISSADVVDKIAQADQQLTVDVGTLINFDSVVDTPTGCPSFINLLSQYKTAEMCLVKNYGAKREVKQQTDRQYWAEIYDKLLEQAKNGEIDLGAVGTGVNTFENNYRKDVEPALGMGKWGEHATDEEIEADRVKYGKQE